MVPELALKFVDSIVIGDAEISFPMLLSDFEQHGTLQRILLILKLLISVFQKRVITEIL
jgi:radical SAM superfamily enzyme YgiQ (UPF0313 family)